MLDSNEYPGTPISLGDSNEFLVAIVQWNVHLFTSQSRKSSAFPNAKSPCLPLSQGRAHFPQYNVPLFTSQPRKSSASPNALASFLPLRPGRALLPPMQSPPVYLPAQAKGELFSPNAMSPSLPLSQERAQLPPMECPLLYLSTPRKSSASHDGMSPFLPLSPG